MSDSVMIETIDGSRLALTSLTGPAGRTRERREYEIGAPDGAARLDAAGLRQLVMAAVAALRGTDLASVDHVMQDAADAQLARLAGLGRRDVQRDG